MTPSGTVTTFYNFCSQLPDCTDGSGPFAGLTLGNDGNFYGVTTYGGSAPEYDAGVVFKITPGGSYTVLYKFCQQSGCADGFNPMTPLIQASDGNFYGTTLGGVPVTTGSSSALRPAATTPACTASIRTHGQFPNGLIQASDGNFYGTADQGGANG